MRLIVSPPQSPSGVMDRTAQIHHWIAFLYESIIKLSISNLYQRGIPSKVPKHDAYNI